MGVGAMGLVHSVNARREASSIALVWAFVIIIVIASGAVRMMFGSVWLVVVLVTVIIATASAVTSMATGVWVRSGNGRLGIIAR